ncbi:MAG: rhomboid family intramembrane serine protease [Prevotellaceae bacterium]|jgi:membrane associated rhomboid family serine protease|nr:rhomboid family intramembrane serine protease [Prevotellaceae bacterium]MDY3856620.1 rhomboid family intramembrane serine protease [Bacteroidaceae bacterium]
MLQTPPATKNLIIINIIMYLAMIATERWGIDLSNMLGLHFLYASNFHVYQLVTYMFMHANLTHIFFNMFTLWMFGRVVESALGQRRFVWLYLICGLGAGLSQEIAQMASYYIQGLGNYQVITDGVTRMSMDSYLDTWTTVGASGACYGVLIAYGMLFPNERVLLLIPPIPMKAKYMVIAFICIDLLSAFGASGDGVAHFAHLGGALVGWLVMLYLRRKDQERNSGFTSWEEYRPQRESMSQRLKRRWEDRKTSAHTWTDRSQQPTETTQEEINHILDKIKQSGYDSLTEEEKNKLFNARK